MGEVQNTKNTESERVQKMKHKAIENLAGKWIITYRTKGRVLYSEKAKTEYSTKEEAVKQIKVIELEDIEFEMNKLLTKEYKLKDRWDKLTNNGEDVDYTWSDLKA